MIFVKSLVVKSTLRLWPFCPEQPWIHWQTWSDLFIVFQQTGFCSHYLVSVCVRSTLNTSSLSNRMLGFDEGVWWAALTLSCPVDHVVSQWTGNTGGVILTRAHGTAATLWGHTSNYIGDVDWVNLNNISTVLPLLRDKKHKVPLCEWCVIHIFILLCYTRQCESFLKFKSKHYCKMFIRCF